MPEINLPEIGEKNWGPELLAAIEEINDAVDAGGSGGGAVSSVAGRVGAVVLTTADIGGINDYVSDDELADFLEGKQDVGDYATNTALTTGLAGKASTTALTTGLAGKADLVSGVVPTSQIPALALSNAVSVASQAAMLALTPTQVQPGDLAVRTDGAGTFMLTATPASTLANWVLLNAPTDKITSVNGQVGTVTLGKADVGLGNADDTADVDKPVSTAQQTALDARAPSLTGTAVVAATDATGNYVPRAWSSTNAGNTTFVVRGTGGVIVIGTPTAANHGTTKAYVDAADGAQQTLIDGKVDKVSAINRVYATDSAGLQTTWEVAQGVVSQSIPRRGSSGVIAVGEPTSTIHAATKNYVDTANALKADAANLNKVQNIGVYTLGVSDPATGIPAGSIILRGPIV